MPWPKYKTEGEIPEGQKDMYHEVKGEWEAKPVDPPEGSVTAEDLATVKGALDKERDERKAAEKKTKVAEAAAAKLKEEAEGKTLGLTEEKIEEFKTQIRADLTEETKGEIADLKTKLEARDGVDAEIRTLKLDTAVKTMMLTKEVGVRGDRVDALFQLATEEFDLTDDGKPKLANHPGKTIETFLKDDLKKKFPEFYVGTKGSGGGAGGSFNSDGSPIGGTTADDILANPKEALTAARAAAE